MAARPFLYSTHYRLPRDASGVNDIMFNWLCKIIIINTTFDACDVSPVDYRDIKSHDGLILIPVNSIL